MTQTINPTVRADLRRYLAMAIIFALMVAMMIWYVSSRYAAHQRMFNQEAANFERSMSAQRSTLGLRIKDTAGFIAAGMTADVATKLRETRLRSPYITSLGFFLLNDPTHTTAFIGKPVTFSNIFSYEYNNILQRYHKYPGIIFTITKNSFTALLPDLPVYSVVMSQSMPIGSGFGSRVVVYAAIDMKALVASAASTLDFSVVKSIRYDSTGFWHRVDYPVEKHWMDAFYEPEEVTFPVSFGRGTNINVTLRSKSQPLASLFVMIFGLAALGAASLIMAIAYQRMQRVSAHKLELALESANKANEAKSLFLANMSHEIRTPLNGVLGMAELLGRSEISSDQQRYVEQIKASGGTLLAILNDILDISKLESGQIAVDFVRTNLPQLITEVAIFFASNAHEKRLELILDLDPRLPIEADVDPVRLRQVLSNLLSNAIKFTEKGEIVLSVNLQTYDPAQQRAIIGFAVTDSGVGISDQNVVKLFSRFTQAENNTTRVYGGTGLGLAICKEICEIMGGSIGVTSEPDRGSTFSFALPVQCITMPEPAKTFHLHLALFSWSSKLRSAVERGVVAHGATITFYNSGLDDLRRAVEDHRKHPFDAMLVDEARHIGPVRLVREMLLDQPETADVPCVVLGCQLTSKGYDTFDLVIVKPFDNRRLMRSLTRILGSNPETADAQEQDVAADANEHVRYDGRRALLVDDNNVNLMFGSEILSQLGFTVATATDGAKAIAAVKGTKFDVIFMDCQMPVIDGYEATRQIRAMMDKGTVTPTPIIAVTANALKGDKERCLAAGMDDFITKPMQVSALESALRNLFRATPPQETQSPEQLVPLPPPPVPAVEASARHEPLPETSLTQPAPAVPAVGGPEKPAPAIMFNHNLSKPMTSADGPTDTKRTSDTEHATDAELIDLSVFNATRESMSNFNLLLYFYRADTSEYLNQIQFALSTRKPADAVLPAHTIKSSSRIIGGEALAQLAEKMELAANQNDPAQEESMNSLFKQMKRAYALTVEQVDTITGKAAAE